MKTEFYDVVLVDFVGILPFKLEKEDIFTKRGTKSKESLETFFKKLEKRLGEEIYYIGCDVFETKLFHRAMIKEAFIEILVGTPITLLAHFEHEVKAKKFKQALEKTLVEIVPDKFKHLIPDAIELKKKQKELTLAKWSKLQKIK